MTIDKTKIEIQQKTCARIPTKEGIFKLCLYLANGDTKEHLALIMGEVTGKESVLVRIHSECFTGDVLGSQRCDCGEQLHRSMEMIAEEGKGVLIYLRQEGRGIGLLSKLKAYNLQDQGYDTVEANLKLGHQADERDYSVAALILNDLGVQSIRLLTNNPLKIQGLQELGIPVVDRLPIQGTVTSENAYYLETKVRRMHHLIDLADLHLDRQTVPEFQNGPLKKFRQKLKQRTLQMDSVKKPFCTLSFAQSVDGCIAAQVRGQLQLSGKKSMILTHRLRSLHDAILVGIGTVISDNPRLTVRLVKGKNPQIVVLDTHLRLPLDANILKFPDKPPWIVTGGEAANSAKRQAIEKLGARVLTAPLGKDGRINISALLPLLANKGIQSIMIEGGAQVITSFLREHAVNQMVITIVPIIVGGLHAVEPSGEQHRPYPHLTDVSYEQLDDDIIIWGEPKWDSP